MAFLTEDDLEQEAIAARRFFQVANQTQPDMPTILFKAIHHGIVKSYRRDKKEPQTMRGRFDPASRKIIVSEAAFCGANKLDADPEAREVFGHEISHAWLGHQLTREFSRVGDATVKPVRADEWQAEYLVAAFLIPAELAGYRPGMVAEELAQKFCVTLRLAKLRLKHLHRLYMRSSSVERPLPSAAIEILNRPKHFLRVPCKECGKPSVLRIGIELICDSCGEKN